MMYHFIQENRLAFPVVKMCQVFKVSKSGFYYWFKYKKQQKIRDQKLLCHLKALFERSQRTYGRPRLTRALKQKGIVVNEKKVYRLMKKHGIFAKTKKRFKTCQQKAGSKIELNPNLVQQNFSAQKPKELWLTDISYIPSKKGWLYLAAVMDVYTRKIVGYSLSQRQSSQLVTQALSRALQQQRPQAGLIVHSDQGRQYFSSEYRNLCAAHGLRMSMSAKGNCYDNAMMESFFHSLKTERVKWQHYQDLDAAKQDIFDYIELYYNRWRLHSGLGYQSPDAFQRAYYTS